MANRIRLFHLRNLLIVLLSNGGPFLGVNGLSSKDLLAKKYSDTGRQEIAPWEVDYDGSVDSAEIENSLEYLINLMEQIAQSLNTQDYQSSVRPYSGMNTLPWNLPPAYGKRSNCCSPDYRNTCESDPYHPIPCYRDMNVDPPPIEPMERSKLRQFTLPHPPIPGPTEIYQYGSLSENDFPGMFDPYSDDSHIPVNPPPIYSNDDWDMRPIFPKLDPQSPPPPPNNPWPPIFLDNLPALSMPHYFRNQLPDESDPAERAQAFFWPWNQNRPKQKPQHQPRGIKQLALDGQNGQVNPYGNPDKTTDEWLNHPLPDKEYNDVTLVLPGGVFSKGQRVVRKRKASNRS